MAKGRKLTTSRSELFLGRYIYGNGHVTAAGADVTELGEEDVWSIVDNMADQDDHVNGDFNSPSDLESNGIGTSIRSRRCDDNNHHRHVGGLSLAFDESGKEASSRILHQYRGHDVGSSPRPHHMATSAPVNVPDWSKILRVNSVESLHDSDDGFDDNESEMMPPHEYLARSRNKATTSVFEGVGRTLKGRDMSRVRDAVWSQTGFDG